MCCRRTVAAPSIGNDDGDAGKYRARRLRASVSGGSKHAVNRTWRMTGAWSGLVVRRPRSVVQGAAPFQAWKPSAKPASRGEIALRLVDPFTSRNGSKRTGFFPGTSCRWSHRGVFFPAHPNNGANGTSITPEERRQFEEWRLRTENRLRSIHH